MWNIITTLVLIVAGFAIKPISIDNKLQNVTGNFAPKVVIESGEVKTSSIGSVTSNNQDFKETSIEIKTPTPSKTYISTISPTPPLTVTPTIHVQEPPDGFNISITPTPIKVFYVEELPIDPLPTKNPCYCDPSKEMHCLDVYNC